MRRVGLDLTAQQLDSFEQFEAALYLANEVMNLTRVPREECWSRHFLDSLLFADLIPVGASVLDIGSGPGFPAWPLACSRPDLKVTALDSNGKMLGFLRTHALQNLEVLQVRAEESGLREAFDLVTGRAVAPMSIQLELSAGPCRIGGLVVPMRTAKDAAEVERLRNNTLGLELREIARRSAIEGERLFPVFVKTEPTPAKFPRSWADIKRKPL